jgi:hypothetical protein|tara:strand:+ start:591 stop:764 length:174 start_codon:yes stop_codon:yes gene_type:complete
MLSTSGLVIYGKERIIARAKMARGAKCSRRLIWFESKETANQVTGGFVKLLRVYARN